MKLQKKYSCPELLSLEQEQVHFRPLGLILSSFQLFRQQVNTTNL